MDIHIRNKIYSFVTKYFPKLKYKGLYDIFFSLYNVRDLFVILKKRFKESGEFLFNGEKLEYFYHTYNNERFTERSIEIPIIYHYLEKSKARICLEIGNVTNHYYTLFSKMFDKRVVIDKYEKGLYVKNIDIKEYYPEEKFNFIYSISTFEHMDSDLGRNPDYRAGEEKWGTYAADNIIHVVKNCLASDGIFIITAPIGKFKEWDETLRKLDFLCKNVLKVKSFDIYYFNLIGEIEWRQVNKDQIKIKPIKRVSVLSIVKIKK